MNLAKSVSIILMLFGGTSASLFSTHLATAVTIKDALGGKRLLPFETTQQEWGLLLNKLEESDMESSGNSAPNPQLLEIKEIAKTGNSANAWKLLRRWCDSSSSDAYSSALQKERKDLKNEVGNHCLLTLAHKLSKEFSDIYAVSRQTIKSEFEEKAKNIKTDTESDFSKEPELQAVKNSTENAGNEWEKIIDWCTSVSEKGFVGEDDNLYKLTKKYCTKTSTN